MRAAETRFETAASNIVRGGALPSATEPGAAPEDDLASSMVALKLASYDFKASAKIVEVGRDMTQTVLDVLA
jgi:flagellar hook protein FlgE